ncbi:hypothetical protein LDENG_00252480 [Lucifuga dentata]|nr:hypothetical protein LDENG_00252480 [Lucifuga dentata]
MDPAHTPSPEDRFEQIERALQQHEERMVAVSSESRSAAAAREQALTALATQVQQLTQTLSQTLAPVQSETPSPAPTLPTPSRPLTFSTEEAKVAYAISHLTRRARLWGTAEWDRHTSTCSSFLDFAAELCKVFDMGISNYDSALELLKMHQGDQTVTDYAIDFRIRARQSSEMQEASENHDSD